MGRNTFQLTKLFWVVPNLSSLASCDPAADDHTGPAPDVAPPGDPAHGTLCTQPETQWKQGRADVFKLDMCRVEILSPPCSAAWFALGHHWNSQSRSEAQPHGSEERFKQQLPPPTLAGVVSSYPQGFSRNKICSHLAFLRKASRESDRLPLPALFLHMLSCCCLIQLLPEKGIPKSLAPSTWEWIQFSVLACFLEDLFPHQFNQSLSEHNIYILASNIPQQRVSIRTVYSGGGKVPTFAVLQVILDYFVWCHLVEKQWMATMYSQSSSLPRRCNTLL